MLVFLRRLMLNVMQCKSRLGSSNAVDPLDSIAEQALIGNASSTYVDASIGVG